MYIVKDINPLTALEIGDEQFSTKAAEAPRAKAKATPTQPVAEENAEHHYNKDPVALLEDEQFEVEAEVEAPPAPPEVEAPAGQPEGEEAPAQHEVEVGEPPEPPEVEAILATPGAEAPVAEPEALGSVLPPPTKKIVKNFDEVGASQRVLAACQDRFRFLTDRKALFVWDGARYGEFDHLAKKWALDALDKVHREYEIGRIHVTEDGQHVEWEDFLKFQGKVRSVGMIRKALDLASLDPRVQVESCEFDAEDYEFNALNGLLKLETGELSPHAPSQLVTKLAPVRWNPKATCPNWEKSIGEITLGNEDYAKFLQRLCGYYLSGSTKEHVLPMLAGGGGNGKTFIQNAMLEVLGSDEYGIALNAKVISGPGMYGSTYFICQLKDKRGAFLSETDEGVTFQRAVMKSLTGGDQQSARAIAKDPIQFKPKVKILLAVNHLPSIPNPQKADKRRLLVLPFNKQFDRKVEQDELDHQVQVEKEGILAWMVRGFQEWRKQGLNPPKVVLEATAAYFEANDHIGTYLKERTETVAGATIPVKLLYADYKAWSQDCGADHLGMHKLSDLLKSREIQQGRTNSARVWLNIALKRVA